MVRTCGLLLALSLLCLASCARITLREAMQEVQKKYFALARTMEAGLEEPRNFDVRDRTAELRRALSDPAIREGNRFAHEEEFQRLLARAIDAVEKVYEVADTFDAYALFGTRDNISYRCQDCHDRYRR